MWGHFGDMSGDMKNMPLPAVGTFGDIKLRHITARSVLRVFSQVEVSRRVNLRGYVGKCPLMSPHVPQLTVAVVVCG
ncbi:hypothetical protein SEA_OMNICRITICAL_74 [Mycobacterium phage OmniCritical]|nr:hypothetical protein SEA_SAMSCHEPPERS_73 [Mycobacterium phage SamScheppers]UUG69765.1 hypothetical protein SEA_OMNICRITICAL_74 [Mycobacterium phage OmniCritical]WRQ08368.1 hypothetical protein JDBV13_00260 [Mycobacterium phage june]